MRLTSLCCSKTRTVYPTAMSTCTSKRIVAIAVDSSDHSEKAFDCKYKYNRSSQMISSLDVFVLSSQCPRLSRAVSDAQEQSVQR